MITSSQRPQKRKGRPVKPFEFGEFSELAQHFLSHCDARINAQSGAIGSGKTINATLAWLKFIGESEGDYFLQSGRTRKSLYANVLLDEMAMLKSFGIDYEHRPGDGELWIEDKLIELMGFSNKAVADVIHGRTYDGWYSDETNVCPKIVIDEAFDRTRGKGARIFCTMNPDSDQHWFYKEILTNKAFLKSGMLRRWDYTLYDNPNLDKEFIKQTEMKYPEGTVDRRRKIWGEWCAADGLIYSQFTGENTFYPDMIPFGNYTDNVTTNTRTLKGLNYDKYMLCIDYGAGNVSVIGLFGVKKEEEVNDKGEPIGNGIMHYHLLNEFYSDSKGEDDPLTDGELIEEGLKLLNFRGLNLPLSVMFTPHDAASMRNELDKNYPYIPHKTYKPDVLNDIRTIQALISNEQFKICTLAKNTIQQIQAYVWDDKSYKDVPLKNGMDHCPDMIRSILCGSVNNFRPFIMNLPMW